MTNQITIEGRITQDAALSYTKSGHAVLNVTVADNKTKPDGNGGYTDMRPAIFHRVAVWGKLGELYAEDGKLVQGAKVRVWGNQALGVYTGRDGEPKPTSDVQADAIVVLAAPKPTFRDDRSVFQKATGTYPAPADTPPADPWATEPGW